MNDKLIAEAAALRAEVNTFSNNFAKVVKRLSEQSETINKTVYRLRITMIGLIAITILGILLTTLVIINTISVDRVQSRTNNQVLCPLYSMLIGSYDKTYHDTLTKDKQRVYDNNFAVLKNGYNTLKCGG
jgi:hypothetical protein